MRITGIDTIPVKGRALVLKMHTDEGLVGWGEPMNYEHWRVVSQAVADMADYLVGRDPCQIEDHWQAMYRSSYSRSMPILVSALSGIEMAMWDIMGKSLGQPVWRLLGGSVRDRIRVYASAGGSESDAIADTGRKRVAEGFNALKFCPAHEPMRFVESPRALDRMVSRVAALRDAVGDEVDIALDFHRRLSATQSIVLLKELEPFKLLFAEEPCHPENTDTLLRISTSTSIPIATGERHLTRWGFREVVEREAAAILQPDIRHCGGILEMKKIANMAETHDIAMAPHNAAGPIGVVASVHAMATVPNFLVCEGGARLGHGLFRSPLVFNNGFVELPTGPGLGIEIDEDALEASRDETYSQRGMWRLEEDNSFADF
jgi:galactonate dehydratase